MFDQVLLEGGRDHDDAVRVTIQKAGNLAESAMERGIGIAHADGGQGLWPEITHLEDERDALAAGDPPA